MLDRGRSMSHVLCETDDTGTITAYYIQGPLLVSRIGADGSQRYYHTNSIGNVVALTDENELITDRYAYTPFGLLTKEGTTDNPFTYVGGLGVMAESDGLYFMRARFYDPDTGRFLGKDPVLGVLTEPQSLHRYVYVLNRPVVLVDASGLSCKGGWQECKSGECLEAIENLFCNVQELSEFHTRMRSFTEQWHQRMAWFAKDPQRIADFLEQFHVQVDDMMSGIRAIGDCFVVLEQCFKSHPPPLPCTDPAPTLTPDLPPDIDWELAREAVGTGALAGGTVLVVGLTAVALASNPVGWAIAAGLGIAALASWAS